MSYPLEHRIARIRMERAVEQEERKDAELARQTGHGAQSNYILDGASTMIARQVVAPKEL